MLRVSQMKKQEKPGGCEGGYSKRMKRKEVRRGETETVGRRRRREYRREKRKRRKEQRKDWGGAEEMRWLQVPGAWVGRDRELGVGTSPSPLRSHLVGLAAGKSGDGGIFSGLDSRSFLMDQVGRTGVAQGSSGGGDRACEGAANGLLPWCAPLRHGWRGPSLRSAWL